MQFYSMENIAKQINDRTYTDYYIRLRLLATTCFEWKNLPNGIKSEWIERYLFEYGRCVFFNHPSLGLMVAQTVEHGHLNAYDEPTKIIPTAVNMPSVRPLSADVDCVNIKNNDLSLPTSASIELYAYRLAEISRTIDINVIAQKTPTLIKCSKAQLLTLKNVYNQWSGNEPVIYADKGTDLTAFEVFKTDAPIVFPDLQVQKQALWNECLTMLGINNANIEKRERLITNEADANNEHIELSGRTMLKARQEAVERINEIFGTDISVDFRYKKEEEIATPNLDKGGEE